MKNKELELFFMAAMEAAIQASIDVMGVYATEFSVEQKQDDSPVTLADKTADDSIRKILERTNEYVLSEEQPPIAYSEREYLKYLWIVDPLDGTKEFIKRNGEFTVNIALVKNNQPVMGIVTAPALNICYWGIQGEGLYSTKAEDWGIGMDKIIEGAKRIEPTPKDVKIIGSRSHANTDTQYYVELLKAMHPKAEMVTKGSSLKLCKIATGEASFYPRFSPINEWDIAAGAALVEAAGGQVLDATTRLPVRFNKENLLQPPFIAIAKGIDKNSLP